MHNHQTLDSFRVGVSIITQMLLLSWGSTALAGPAGKFIYSFGDVKVTSKSGESRIAAKGQTLNEGDLISAGADGSAQIQMQDQGMLAVRANTKVRIDEFRYQGKQDGSERSVMTLLQGGLRAITGAVGNQNKQNYRINTPTATIGIRGTDHEPFVVPEGAHPFGQAQPGTYDKVNTGEAYIQTPLGKVAIQPNQVGFAGASNARPVLLPAVPALFKATPAEKPGDAKQGKPDDRAAAKNDQPKTGGNDRPPAEGSPPPPPPPPPAGATASAPPLMPLGPDNRAIQAPINASAGAGTVNFTSQQITNASGEIVDGNTPLLWPGQLPVVAGAADDSATQQSGPGAGSEYGSGVQADLYGRLLRIQNGTFYFDHGTAQLAEVGRLSMPLKDGQAMPVVWGRWHAVPPDQLFSITDEGKVLQPTGNMHYAVAPVMTPLDQLTPANLGMKAASYSLLAGTQPSTELPNSAGTLQALDILVDFASQQIADYKLQLSVSGRTYTASASQKVGLGSQFIVPLQASCTGCSSTATLTGEAEGAFIGPKAEGIITGYAIGKNSTEYTYGAAVLGQGKSLTSLPGTGSTSGPILVGADMELSTTGTYATGAGVHSGGGINLDGNRNVIGINQGTFVFAAHTAPLVDSGSVALPVDGGGQQQINWGRWEKQSSTTTFNVSNNNILKNSVGSFHFLVADQISSATSLSSAAMGGATATYSLLGGTRPTSEISGEIGTLRSLQATVDFSQQKISSYQLQVDFANRSFKANGGGINIAPTFSVGLSGDCQGCSSANPTALIPVTGQANGAFIGPKAEGMISSFGLQTQNADRAVSGVAVLKR